MDNKFRNVINYFREDKKRRLVFLFAALGIVLLILSFGGDGEKNDSYDSSLGEYAEALEDELEKLCSSIDGAGKCIVKVSFACGEKYEYKGTAKIGSEPPKVLGVSVIAEGADNAEVRRAISESMRALFDIGSNRVSVQKMK